LALISVPGAYAGAEALQALRAGLHVMLFSDNVPVETEVALKRLALERGLLMMGPDCGTAIVDGVPLGFANAVPRGRIGLAAASGTGLQETTCTIAREGEGVSQAIGVGGRDLSDEVGGLMMLRALELLAGDAATEVVCLVGKPPGAGVARRLADAAAKLGKPCVAYFAGASTPAAGPWRVAATLEDAGRAAVVLGYGAHRDPAGEIVPAIRAVRARRPLAVVASVCGTDGDPQSRAAQIATLRDAGVIVMDGNAQAARLAAAIARRAGAR